jgi:hypothetical protein
LDGPIVTREVAEAISALMLDYGAKLDGSVRLVMAHSPEHETARYRCAIGKIMGEMLLEIMNPIYSEFPDLKPPQLNDQ